MLDMMISYDMALAVTDSISKTEFKKMDNVERLKVLRFVDDAISLTYGTREDVKKKRVPFEKKYKELDTIHNELKQKMINSG